MFEFYRKKVDPGLCYKVVAWNAQIPDSKVAFNPFGTTYVVIQFMKNTPHIIKTEEFWDTFEGVEDEDLPPIYKNS